MNTRPPKLRKHASGLYVVRWAGRDRYLGRDPTEAQKRYLKSLEEWTAWRTVRNTQRLPPMTQAYTLAEIVARFIEAKELERGPDLRRYYAKHLKRLLHAYGPARADQIRARHLQAVKAEMMAAGYAPKTISHDLIAAKAVLTWAAGLEYIPPVMLKGVRTPALGPPPDKSLSVKAVRKWVLGTPAPLQAWLAITYLGLMRPSETVRVVNAQGDWAETGVFRLDRGKVDRSARMARHVVFSPEALRWLKQCEPVWSRLDTFSAAVRRECGAGGPHPLRHSAATHLVQAGVPRADVDLLLGHAPPRVSLTYARIVWPPLRRTVARLSLKSTRKPRRG
jgi:integrase